MSNLSHNQRVSDLINESCRQQVRLTQKLASLKQDECKISDKFESGVSSGPRALHTASVQHTHIHTATGNRRATGNARNRAANNIKYINDNTNNSLKLPFISSLYNHSTSTNDDNTPSLSQSLCTSSSITQPSTTRLLPRSAIISSTLPHHTAQLNSIEYEKSLNLKSGMDAIKYFAQHGSSMSLKFVYAVRSDLLHQCGQQHGKQANKHKYNDLMYRPYELSIVSQRDITSSVSEYYTISGSGIVHCVNQQYAQAHKDIKYNQQHDSQCISLSEWVHQMQLFNTLQQIQLFHQFRLIKQFAHWKQNTKYQQFIKQYAKINKILLVAADTFITSIQHIYRDIDAMSSIELHTVRTDITYDITEYTRSASEIRNACTGKYEQLLDGIHVIIDGTIQSIIESVHRYEANDNENTINNKLLTKLNQATKKIESMIDIKNNKIQQIKQYKYHCYQQSRLYQFIRCIDYMHSQQLIHSSIAATQHLLKHIHSIRNKTVNKPLFTTVVTFTPNNSQSITENPCNDILTYTPNLNDILNCIKSVQHNTLVAVDNVPRIIHNTAYKQYIDSRSVCCDKISDYVNGDETYNSTLNSIIDSISSDYASVQATVAFLHQHATVYQYNTTFDVNEYCATRTSLDDIKADFALQTGNIQLIKYIRDYYDAGCIECDIRQLKQLILPLIESNFTSMKQHLYTLFHSSTYSLHADYVLYNKQLDDDSAQSLPLFTQYIKTVDDIKSKLPAIHQRTSTVRDMYQLMIAYNLQSYITSQDYVVYDDLLQSSKSFNAGIAAVDQRISNKLPGMQAMIHKNIDRINNELAIQHELLLSDTLCKSSVIIVDAQKQLKSIEYSISDIQSQILTLQSYQSTLQLSVSEFDLLTNVQTLLHNQTQHWKLQEQFEMVTKQYNNTEILLLNSIELHSTISTLHDSITSLNEYFNQSEHTSTLLKQCSDTWVCILPMLLALTHASVKPSHWRKIFQSLNQPYFSADKLKIKKLRSIKLFESSDIIEEICESAVNEYNAQQPFQTV